MQLHELDALLAKHASIGIKVTGVPGLFISSCASTTQPELHLFEPLFCGVTRGKKSIFFKDEAYQYESGNFLVVGLNMPIASAVTAGPVLGFTLILDLGILRELLLELSPEGHDIAEMPPSIGVHNLDGDLLDAVTRLIRLLDSPSEITIMAPLLHKEILYRLLLGDAGTMLRQLASPSSQFSKIHRVLHEIRSRFAQTVAIHELAEIAGMSAATLHRHFRNVTGLSPLQYQKQIRLQEARRLLLIEHQNTVDVAFAVGYESSSQFNREYRRAFGAPPAQDTARIRDSLEYMLP